MSVIIAEIKIATKRLLKIPRQNPFRFRIFHPLIHLELKRPNTLIHYRNSFETIPDSTAQNGQNL